MTPKSLEVAVKGLPNTIYGVSVIDDTDGSVVGMGRIIGDGHVALCVVDVAVFPEHQKKGLGKRIMEALHTWIKENTTKDCYITLMARGDAKYLYEKYGFFNGSDVGMIYRHEQ